MFRILVIKKLLNCPKTVISDDFGSNAKQLHGPRIIVQNILFSGAKKASEAQLADITRKLEPESEEY